MLSGLGSGQCDFLQFIWHQSLKFDPSGIKVLYLTYTGCEVRATPALGPKFSPSGSVSKKVDGDIAKAPSDWKGPEDYSELTTPNWQAQAEAVPPALIIKALKEPWRQKAEH